jgi:hypothetical protein
VVKSGKEEYLVIEQKMEKIQKTNDDYDVGGEFIYHSFDGFTSLNTSSIKKVGLGLKFMQSVRTGSYKRSIYRITKSSDFKGSVKLKKSNFYNYPEKVEFTEVVIQ